MKTYRNSILMAAAIATIAFIPSAQAADQVKGATKLLELIQVKTVAEVETLKTDDTIAMVCVRCKTVWVSRVKQGMKGAEILMAGGKTKELIGTHACAGCKSTMTVVGHGKAKTDVIKHSCRACGHRRHGEEVGAISAEAR
jgi:formate-dependent nitrite reductase cytochrome c552 subunit